MPELLMRRSGIATTRAWRRWCLCAWLSRGRDRSVCLLSAVGSTARSRFRYIRIMGMKEDTVRNIGFNRLAIFRPGIIVGNNAHTPTWARWLGTLVPGPFGNIGQRVLSRSIAVEIAAHGQETGEVIYENAAMKQLAKFPGVN